MKPKLVLIRSDISAISPVIKKFAFCNKEDALRIFFELFIISEDSKYEDIIVKYKPDLIALYYHPLLTKKISIEGLDKNNSIPKIGILGVDEIAPERFIVIDYYEKLGLQAYFTTGSSYTHYYSSLAAKIYHWPWFINDSDTYNINLEKECDFFLSSHNYQTYPWRQKIFPILKEKYKYNLIHSSLNLSKPIFGSDFYQLINKSCFAATCGGYPNAIVMKHFEIPYAATCLVTEDTEIIREAGFKDMVNCVFVDEENVIEKIDYLINNPKILSNITKAGVELVLENHMAKNRSQILDWYNLYKNKSENYKIIQDRPFDTLKLVPTESPSSNFTVGYTKDSVLLKDADKQLFDGHAKNALTTYQFLNNEFLNYSPDFKTRLCLAHLLEGNTIEALKDIYFLINFELSECKNEYPEPIEWCLLLYTVLLIDSRDNFSKLFRLFNFEGYLFWNLLKNIYCEINHLKIEPIIDMDQNIDFHSAHSFLNLTNDELINKLIYFSVQYPNGLLIQRVFNKPKFNRDLVYSNSYIENSKLDKKEIIKQIVEPIIYKISKFEAVRLKLCRLVSNFIVK